MSGQKNLGAIVMETKESIFARNPSDSVRLFGFTVGHITLPLNYFVKGESGEITVPVTAYLIDHPRGLVIFDTGLGPRFERPVGAVLTSFVDLEVGNTIDVRLRAIGIDPESIKLVIVSHLHSDHAGGNLFFKNATIIVQDAEHDFAFHGAQEDPIYCKAEYDTGQPFMRINGEYDVFGDGTVVVFPTLGHTPGHQSARVRTASGEVVLAGDCCSLQRSLDDFRLPEHCHNADLYIGSLKTLAKMRERGARIFFGHDPGFWETIPKGVPIT
jgi:N-acyl homoserine lactone hydrolase